MIYRPRKEDLSWAPNTGTISAYSTQFVAAHLPGSGKGGERGGGGGGDDVLRRLQGPGYVLPPKEQVFTHLTDIHTGIRFAD